MLKSGRKAIGLTQRSVADRLGIDFTYVSKIESDALRFSPSDQLLYGFAALYGIDSDDLFVAAGKCPPDLETRLSNDRDFVCAVRALA